MATLNNTGIIKCHSQQCAANCNTATLTLSSATSDTNGVITSMWPPCLLHESADITVWDKEHINDPGTKCFKGWGWDPGLWCLLTHNVYPTSSLILFVKHFGVFVRVFFEQVLSAPCQVIPYQHSFYWDFDHVVGQWPRSFRLILSWCSAVVTSLYNNCWIVIYYLLYIELFIYIYVLHGLWFCEFMH